MDCVWTEDGVGVERGVFFSFLLTFGGDDEEEEEEMFVFSHVSSGEEKKGKKKKKKKKGEKRRYLPQDLYYSTHRPYILHGISKNKNQ